jgi:hypothetical protein
MKRSIWIPLLIVTALLIIGTSQYPKLSIATGYGAKCMASGVFVAGREANSVKENDLDYSIVKYTRSKIDYQEKSVTTTIFGLAKQKAVYREVLGCCLVAEQEPLPPLKTPSQTNTSTTRSWRSPWPEGDGKSDILFSELDTTKLQYAVDWAFDEPETKIKKTCSVVVIYKGKLVAEKYWGAQSITSDTKLWGWSMNKSIVNAMVGVLVKQGKLSVQASAPVEEWLQDKRREIKINDLLHMSSGLKWNEDYGDLSDVTTMLYKEPDCYKFAIGSPFGKDPDLEYKYSSGTTNIVSGIIRRTLGNDQLYFAFPYHEIANKIGMSSLLMETDASGNFVGSSYGYATARDWAKFGQLYLQDGVWKGDSILPKGWVSYTTTSAKAANGKYGAFFWLNRAGDLPDVPQDMFACQGHRGQRVFIIPSKQLVVVRLGFGEEHFDHNQFLKGILSAIGASK